MLINVYRRKPILHKIIATTADYIFTIFDITDLPVYQTYNHEKHFIVANMFACHTKGNLSYAAENGIPVAGLVKDEVDNKAMPNLNVTLFADAAKGDKIYIGNTNTAGRFGFTGLQLYGTQNIKLASVNAKGQKKGSLWLDTIRPLPVRTLEHKVYAADTTTDAGVTTAITKRETVIKNTKLKAITNLKEVSIKANKSLRTLDNGIHVTTWGPPQIFNITAKDYWTKTLEWFAEQSFKGAHPGPLAGVYFLGDRSFPLYPIMIVDGKVIRPVFWEIYYSMPIEKFNKIEVQEAFQATDERGTPFIPPQRIYMLYLTMKPGYWIDNPGTLNAQVSGYYEACDFYEPPSGAKPSVADYRTTIHWQPNIKTDMNGRATLSYYNAVPGTHIRILVQGVTHSGTPVSETTMYEVK